MNEDIGNVGSKLVAGHSGGTRTDKPLPAEACNQFRRTGGELIRQSAMDESVVGACAVHVGIQFMLRDFDSEQVASWLEKEARTLRDFAHLAERTPGAGNHRLG
jgi:hypothetical protein